LRDRVVGMVLDCGQVSQKNPQWIGSCRTQHLLALYLPSEE